MITSLSMVELMQNILVSPVAAVKSAALIVTAYCNGVLTEHFSAIFLVLLLVILYFLFRIYNLMFAMRNPLYLRAKSIVNSARDQVETLDEEFDPLVERVTNNVVYPPVCVKVVQAAHIKFGFVNDNKANRLMLSKFIREWFIERGLRPSHIVSHFPIALELCFMLTPSEKLAFQMRRCVQEDRSMIGQPDHSL